MEPSIQINLYIVFRDKSHPSASFLSRGHDSSQAAVPSAFNYGFRETLPALILHLCCRRCPRPNPWHCMAALASASDALSRAQPGLWAEVGDVEPAGDLLGAARGGVINCCCCPQCS